MVIGNATRLVQTGASVWGKDGCDVTIKNDSNDAPEEFDNRNHQLGRYKSIIVLLARVKYYVSNTM